MSSLRSHHVGCHAIDHIAILRGPVVKQLLPDLQAHKAPQLSGKTLPFIEVAEDHVRMDIRPRTAFLRSKKIENEPAQLSREPLLERHRESHFVSPLHEFGGEIRCKRRL